MNKNKNVSSAAILMSFGFSFAVRLIVIAVFIGGYIDDKFFGSASYTQMILALALIFFSFWDLYKRLKE